MTKPVRKQRLAPLDDRFAFSETAVAAGDREALRSSIFEVEERATGAERTLKLWRKIGGDLDRDLRELWRYEMRQVTRIMAYRSTSPRRFGLFANPAAGIPTEPKVTGSRWLKEDEFVQLYRWLECPDAPVHPPYTRAVRILMLTGQRVEEIAQLHKDQWEAGERITAATTGFSTPPSAPATGWWSGAGCGQRPDWHLSIVHWTVP